MSTPSPPTRRSIWSVFPKHVTVAGGGYIAVEFAGIFNGLGAQTAQLYRGEQILRGFDDDLRYGVAEEMLKKNIDLRTHSVIEALEPDGDRYKLTLNSGDVLETDLVMFATGRHPNTDDLGLDKAGVELNDAGAVAVDAYSRTNVENIYAVGDVTDRLALTPIAIPGRGGFRRDRLQRQPDRGRPRDRGDRRLLPARTRYGRPDRGRGARVLRRRGYSTNPSSGR